MGEQGVEMVYWVVVDFGTVLAILLSTSGSLWWLRLVEELTSIER